MAVPGVKIDDGTGGFPSNCFPVRGILRGFEDGAGAWLTAHNAEQRRRFKAVLCAKPRTFEQIRDERKRAVKEGTAIVPPPVFTDSKSEEEERILDGFFLMKHCCIEDPADLCSVNISSQNLTDVKQEDFVLFDNVAYINCGENILPFESLKFFPILRELEMPLNGLRNLMVNPGDFAQLEILDLSYNNLSPDDLLMLGMLPRLKVLHVTGNNLRTLPANLARPFEDPNNSERKIVRFAHLEVLLLDDNRISDVNAFAALAGLRRLRHLNLSKNEIHSVPQLMVLDGRHVTQEIELDSRKSKRTRSSQRSARKSKPTSPDKGRSTSSRMSGRDSRNQPVNSTLVVGTEVDLHRNSAKEMTKEVTVADLAEQAPVETATSEVASKSETKKSSDQDGGVGDASLHEDDEDIMDFGALTLEGIEAVEYTMKESRSNTNSSESKDEDMAELGELNLDAIDEKVTEQMKKEAAENNEAYEEATEDTILPPPFSELIYLNLSHNQIVEEEGLLAVAAWPMVSELVIHNNPLTTETSGDPPLLKRYLTRRLGIHIIRKPPGPMQKPPTQVQNKPERKVQTQVPQVPKRDIEEVILAIEASVKPALKDILGSVCATPTSPSRQASPAVFSSAAPLPDITRTPRSQEQPADETTTEENAGDHVERAAEGAGAFFMTQVEEGDLRPRPPSTVKPPVSEKPQQHRRATRKMPVNDKYRGYEALLHTDDEIQLPHEDIPMPKDIQGSVQALHYTLSHPIIFQENEVHLEHRQKPFKPYQRNSQPKPTKRKTKQEQMTEILGTLKDQATTSEADLGQVLKTKPLQKQFPEATTLLADIQRKYNMVRQSSMHDSHGLNQELMKDMMDQVQSVATH